jgi:hypothetical protein
MTSGSVPSAAFSPRPDDDDDVRWALSTALVQWNRGGKADAVVWLRRAAEAADASGAPARAQELRGHAAGLAESLWVKPSADDIEIDIDIDRGGPLPPPPEAVIAAQRKSQRPGPPLPSFQSHTPEPQSLGSVDSDRGHFASAPEIVLEEEALDPTELEEILDYVGEDDVEYLEEVPRAAQSAREAAVGRSLHEFSDRLSSADVEPTEAEAVIAYHEAEPLEFTNAPAEDSAALHDRISDTEAFELQPAPSERPSATVMEREAPGLRAPFEQRVEEDDDDFEDRATLVPSSDDGSEAEPLEFDLSASPLDPVLPAVAFDDSDESLVKPSSRALGAAKLPTLSPESIARSPESIAPSSQDLLVGASELAIDADIHPEYQQDSVDLGADWAPIESDRASAIHRAPSSAAPALIELPDSPATLAHGVEAEIEAAPETMDAEWLEEAVESRSSEPLSIDEDDLISVTSVPPESLPALEFPSEPPGPLSDRPASSPRIEIEALVESLPEEALQAPLEDRQTFPGASVESAVGAAEPQSLLSAETLRGATAITEPPTAAVATPAALAATPVAHTPAAATPLTDVPAATVSVVPSSAPAALTQSSRPTPLWSQGTVVDGIDLMTTRGFEDLPEEVQERLAQLARVEVLAAGEEVGLFGAAIVTHGQVGVMPAFADEAGASGMQADVVFTRGTLEDSIALRVVAKVDDTRVAVWDSKPLAEAIEDCPWVHDELRLIADRYLALCGAALGPLGERLDESLRSTVFQRLEVRTFSPFESLTTAGQPLPGLFVVGGGRVEILSGDQVAEEKSPGDFLFATAIMSGAKSPATARAGAQGALVLFAPRSVAHELMISVPPLLEVLAG